MLRSTFCHLPGISQEREKSLWEQGVTDWDELEATGHSQLPLFANHAPRSTLLRELDASRRALEEGDVAFFASRIPKQHHYRLAAAFPQRTVFLDIETTGLSRYYDYLTLVGWSIGSEYFVTLRGEEPDALKDALTSAKVLVTFNGTIFDIPFLAQEYAGLDLPFAHVDLRFAARRVGLQGGQKEIERQLGRMRSAEIADVQGQAAPILWHRFRRGDLEAIRTLLSYNHADIEGMRWILDAVIERSFGSEQVLPRGSNGWHRFSDLRSDFSWSELAERAEAYQRVQLRGQVLRPSATIEDLIFTDREPILRVVGVDLTGADERPTGWCLLAGRSATTTLLRTDREILSETVSARPHVVSIDSPLSLPTGRIRVTDDDPGRESYGIMRYCERVLKRRGVNVYPALIPSMQRLTSRGMRLARELRRAGIPVIESYPGAAQDIMNIPRKRAGLEFLEAGLAEFGVTGEFLERSVSHDELDAITAAIVGVFFWSGRFERLGPEQFGEEALIIPDLHVDPTLWRKRPVIGFSGALASGKTTSARQLRDAVGLQYRRYSDVIEALTRTSRTRVTRENLQRTGRYVHRRYGQRWLGRKLLAGVDIERGLVLDGLRFHDDHAFLVEAFGSAFVHVHIRAPRRLRQDRYQKRGGTAREFAKASEHSVEREVESLEALAHVLIDNDGTTQQLAETVGEFVIRES